MESNYGGIITGELVYRKLRKIEKATESHPLQP